MSSLATRPNGDTMPAAVDEDYHEQSTAISMEHLEAVTRAEIDCQIKTAKAFPRSVKRFLQEAESLATLDEGIAKRCIYAVPRAGKTITGPSIRLAEIVASCWKNMRTTTRIVSETDRFIVAEAVCLDLESNNGWRSEVRRRITDSKGRRFNDDMIATTANAALSIAGRNAIFRVVPAAFVDRIFEAAKRIAISGGETIEVLRRDWVEAMKKKGVREGDLYRVLGVAGEEDMTLEHIEVLIGFQTAVQSGENTYDEIFRTINVETRPDTKEASRLEALKQRGAESQATTHAEPAKPEPEKAIAPLPPKSTEPAKSRQAPKPPGKTPVPGDPPEGGELFPDEPGARG